MTDNDGGGEITLVGSFQKNAQEAVCVGVNQWKGTDYFFIRIFAPVLGTDDLVPTKKGINLEYRFIDEVLDGVKKLGEIMGGDQVVKTISKSDKQEIRICSSTYREMPLLNIRVYMKFNDNADFSPTAKGISIRTEQYPLLLDVVNKLHKHVTGELAKE
jgi:hypothetical protein